MPVALPPPAPPIAVHATQVPRGGAHSIHRFGSHTLHLRGFDDIDAEEIAVLVRKSPDAEKLLLGLSNLVYASGYLTSRLVYAVSGKELYVALVHRPIRKIEAREEMRQFFDGNGGGDEFDLSEFERNRVLASTYSDRAQWNVQPRFVDAPGDAVDLRLETRNVENPSSFKLQSETNNHGNRFAGRNTVALGLIAEGGGMQASLQARTSPSSFNESSMRGSYQEGTAGVSVVTTGGMLSVNLRRLEFSAEAQSIELDGWYQEAALELSNLMWASLESRSSYRLRASYGDRQTELAEGGIDLFHERFVVGELAPSYATTFDSSRLEGSLAVVGGGAVSQHNSAAASEFHLLRPLLRHTWAQNDVHELALTVGGQWTSEVLPESQQWTLGGSDSIVAYAPATLVGDSGFLVRVAQAARVPLGYGWRTSAEVFTEYAQAHRVAGDVVPASVDRAADVGLALALAWSDRLGIDVRSAIPFVEPDNPEAERIDFYASVRFSF